MELGQIIVSKAYLIQSEAQAAPLPGLLNGSYSAALEVPSEQLLRPHSLARRR